MSVEYNGTSHGGWIERPATGATTELDRATIFGLSGRVSIEQPSYGAV